MKALAEDDLGALLAVLPPTAALASGPPLRPLDRKLPGSAVRTDLLAGTPAAIVHGEYVKDLTPDLALRMVDYRLRIRRRHPGVAIVQFVLVLRDGVVVPDRYDDPDGALTASWHVVHVGGLDRDRLLSTPTSAALAALARGSTRERAQALVDATAVIATLEPSRRRRLLDAAVTLASIQLPSCCCAAASETTPAYPPLPKHSPPWPTNSASTASPPRRTSPTWRICCPDGARALRR